MLSSQTLITFPVFNEWYFYVLEKWILVKDWLIYALYTLRNWANYRLKFLTGFHFSLITLNDHNPQFMITLIKIHDEHIALFD